jgi:hypothetical protein
MAESELCDAFLAPVLASLIADEKHAQADKYESEFKQPWPFGLSLDLSVSGRIAVEHRGPGASLRGTAAFSGGLVVFS